MTPTSHDIRMHRFGPAHTAGAFGSPLSWLQVGVLLAGMYAAYLVFASTGVAGMLLAVGVVLATCVVVFVPMRGREPIEWLPLILHALAARLLGQRRRRSTAPGAGFAASENQPDAAGRSPMPDLPPDLKGVEILDAAFDRHRVGIIKDTRARTYAAVLKVRVGAFGLLSTSDQARRIEAWSSLLTSLCREGTPISRVQWIERTIPTDPDELVRYHLTRRDFVRDKTDDRELRVTHQRLDGRHPRPRAVPGRADLDAPSTSSSASPTPTKALPAPAAELQTSPTRSCVRHRTARVLKPRTLAKHIRSPTTRSSAARSTGSARSTRNTRASAP